MAKAPKVRPPASAPLKPGQQHQSAQQHRGDKPADAEQGERLAAVPVALPRPKRGQRHPQHSRPGVGHRHPEIGDADLPPDRRHHRLKRRISRRRDQHGGIEQEEVRRRQRASGDARAGGNERIVIALSSPDGCESRPFALPSALHLPTPATALHFLSEPVLNATRAKSAERQAPPWPPRRPRAARARAGSSCGASSSIR